MVWLNCSCYEPRAMDHHHTHVYGAINYRYTDLFYCGGNRQTKYISALYASQMDAYDALVDFCNHILPDVFGYTGQRVH